MRIQVVSAAVVRFTSSRNRRFARLFAEVSVPRAHILRSPTEAEQFPVVHAPQPGAERFQVHFVFSGEVGHHDLPISTPEPAAAIDSQDGIDTNRIVFLDTLFQLSSANQVKRCAGGLRRFCCIL